MTGTTLDARDLLAEVGWLQRLARHMVRDAQLAEELAQETCAVALERSAQIEDREVRLRPWLASVMRNALRQRLRGDARREERERRSARAEAQPSSSELVERVHLQRELVEAVLELEEPSRQTVIMRFFEDLPPREIARRMDVPVATVDSRIQRGLARLRARLDKSHREERAAWWPLVVSLAEPSRNGAAATVALAVNIKVITALVTVAALGALLAVTRSGDAPSESLRTGSTTDPVAAAPTEPAGLERETPGVATARGEERQELAPPSARTESPALEAPAVTDAPFVRVRGRVLDSDAQPVADVEVGIAGTEPAAKSGAGGWFELDAPAAEGRLVSMSGAWVTLFEGVFRPSSTIDPTVIVARPVDLAGRVVDPSGRPLPGAHVSLVSPDELEARFEHELDASHGRGLSTTSDDQGRFDFDDAPTVAGSSLRAVLAGYAVGGIDAPAGSSTGLEIALSRPDAPQGGLVEGRVVDPDGQAVSKARVSLGLTSTLTDGEGRFQFGLARAVTAERMVAVKTGHMPAVAERPLDPDEGVGGWPDFVELVLGGEPLSLSGTVVDASGEPLPSAQVWLAAPTPFGTVGLSPLQLEALSAGATVPPQATLSASQLPREDGDANWSFNSGGAPPTAVWNYTRTDDEGHFRVEGLADRRYKLKVLDARTMRTHETRAFRAGRDDVRIEVPNDGLLPRIAGVVSGPSGRPIDGVRVRLYTTPYQARSRVFGGRVHVGFTQVRESVHTDAEGRFEFADVPEGGMKLSLFADAIVPRDFEVSTDLDVERIQIPVELRCRLRVELAPPVDRADMVGAVDENGTTLELIVVRGESISSTTHAKLSGGRTEVLSVSSAARALLLFDDGEEVGRVALSLNPDEITLVRP